MKKILTILALVVAILAGSAVAEAKTTKRSSKAKTTKTTSKKVVAEARVLDAPGCDTYKFFSNGEFTYSDRTGGICDGGSYFVNNGAYIFVDRGGYVEILTDEYIYVITLDTAGGETLIDWTQSNASTQWSTFKRMLSYNRNSGILYYTINGRRYSLDIGMGEYKKIKWIKK